MTDDVPLFDIEATPVRKPKRQPPKGKATWTPYSAKRPMKCDDCLLVLAEAKGSGPATRQARWRRTVDGSYLLLCYAHAEIRRTDDTDSEKDR